ncbi:16S rRNA (guanine(966)-N(2))-methyltransferase RsmD [Nocardioides dongxiaopingii]|uniref:16S rRNA (guanine(966)-N(2))-methyltransferase RsmD n=1 Tax=Nocardioides sp. S-1144 TaxID=2582905 RepID=UPI00116255E9|nr:16S rRNA (guanine(966)-N(2))-methyltransferase RsmD [Nocardioides sp. S-1144]QDH11037.1 16S rRNA (guanine(966)-N(2))-methyltransferase RsmD [Nocardioides sp. S-1144]
MTRIIAGTAKGRRLQTPPGEHTRPTTDRVREALFSAVESWAGSLHGLRFLDLYAGSGAVGLEAWSRGAAGVTLVESDRATASLIEQNARTLGFADAEVHATRVQPCLARVPQQRYDVVYSDPPYPLTETDLAEDLDLLTEWLAPDALVVVERSRRSPEPTWPTGARPILGDRSKRYGETVLWYGHAP